MGYPQWKTDVRFQTHADRVKNRTVLIALLTEQFISRPVNYWVKLLKGYPVAKTQGGTR